MRRRSPIARTACRGAGLWLAALCGWARAADDPFADVAAAPMPARGSADVAPAWTDNLLYRRELYVLLGAGRDDVRDTGDLLTRVSAGFEVQKRFSTDARTIASFDYQGRVVYRDHTLATAADAMGMDADAWEYETHNAYLDVYNLFGELGRCSARVGSFYPPFGLNQQTDTHGTLLQLSNDQVFGTDRDWQATLYGSLNDSLDYTAGFLLGGGPEGRLAGQSGLGVARLALQTDWLYRQGLEGGVSFAAGERVDEHAMMRSRSVARATGGGPVIETWRAGADLRRTVTTEAGPVAFTLETAVGRDEDDPLVSGLVQADWLHPSRRFGAALQLRRFWQDVGAGGENVDTARAVGAVTYYLRNDVGQADVHGVTLAVEYPLPDDGGEDPVLMVQYYRYW